MYNTIDENLKGLDHLSLRDLASWFEKQAELCHQAAFRNAQTPDERQAGAIDYLLRTPRIVMRYLKTGCTLEEAKKRTAEDTGAPLGSIERAWMRFVYDKSDYEMKRRNRLIIELACMGFTNADIGRKVNMHPNSVSRIIGNARRAHHSPRQVEKGFDMIENYGIIKS